MKISEQFLSYRADSISILIIMKGHNSVQNVHGVTILVLYILSNDSIHICTSLVKYLKLF